MTIFELVLLPILAFFIGIIAAMLGIGGGVFIVPTLQLLPLSIPFTPHLAAGTSLAVILFKSLSSTSRYAQQKRIDYKAGLVLAAASVPGAFTGAHLAEAIDEELLILLFSLFLSYVAIRMITGHSLIRSSNLGPGNLISSKRKSAWKRQLVDSDGKVFLYDFNLILALPLSFLAGVSSGVLGIGGGALMVPMMIFALSFPMHIAVATSVFIMVFTSSSGVAAKMLLNEVQFEYALLMAIGVIFGGQLGAIIGKRTSSKSLQRIFGFVLLIVSIRMFLKFVGV